jgi:hypothetical protein
MSELSHAANHRDEGMSGDALEADRRRSARFSCAGEAKISPLPSDGVFLPGKILDLSLHGCRVDTTLTVDCGVRTEIVLCVNSSTFRAVGVVKAIRGASGTGIEFVQLSAGGKDMLADLIRELARLRTAMNKLRAGSVRAGGRSFRRQLEEGKSQANDLGNKIAALEKVIATDSAGEISEPKRAVSTGGNPIVQTRPLVITVDLFG